MRDVIKVLKQLSHVSAGTGTDLRRRKTSKDLDQQGNEAQKNGKAPHEVEVIMNGAGMAHLPPAPRGKER